MKEKLERIHHFLNEYAWKAFPFMILKKPLALKVSGHALIPLLGFFNLIVSRKIFKPTKLFLILFSLGLIPTLINANTHSLIRYTQFLGVILFFQAIQEFITKEKALKICEWICYLAGLVHTIEAIFIGPRSIKGWFGITLPRYNGIVGEPNFSGALLFGIFIIFLLRRKYWHTLFTFILIFSTGGRTAVLLSIAFFLSHLIVQKLHFLSKVPVLILSILIIGTPFLGSPLTTFFKESPQSYSRLDTALSKRLTILRAYTNIYKDHLMGIGYFNGPAAVQKVAQEREIDHVSEEHNLYLETLVELGPFAYFMLAFILFSIFRSLLPIYQNALGFFLIFFYFFNGLHEFILYFALHVIPMFSKTQSETKDV